MQLQNELPNGQGSHNIGQEFARRNEETLSDSEIKANI
jgi:hypothetical protein